jgi:hypothetical protein
MSLCSAGPIVRVLHPFNRPLRVGELLTVSDSAVAVTVSRTGAVLDCVGPGRVEITADGLPNTCEFLGSETSPDAAIDIAVLEVYPSGCRMLEWETEVPIAAGSPGGGRVIHLAGRAQIRITEPRLFVSAVLGCWHSRAEERGQLPSLASPTGSGEAWAADVIERLPEQAEAVVARAIADQVAHVAAEVLSCLAEHSLAIETIRARAQAPVEAWLRHAGMRLEGFGVDELPEPASGPCESCGSFEAPTAYATFHRNISLFVVRFHSRREGYYCFPCGVKIGLLENLIMLVGGWWGIIGLIVTPFLMLWNFYAIIRLWIGPRVSASETLTRAKYLGPGS